MGEGEGELAIVSNPHLYLYGEYYFKRLRTIILTSKVENLNM